MRAEPSVSQSVNISIHPRLALIALIRAKWRQLNSHQTSLRRRQEGSVAASRINQLIAGFWVEGGRRAAKLWQRPRLIHLYLSLILRRALIKIINPHVSLSLMLPRRLWAHANYAHQPTLVEFIQLSKLLNFLRYPGVDLQKHASTFCN
jgi:hypothetical protein